MTQRFAAPLVALILSLLWSPAVFAYDPRAGDLACADCHGEGFGEETPAAPVPGLTEALGPALALSAAAPVVWSEAENVSASPGGSELCRSNGKALAVDRTGRLHAVWHDRTNGIMEVHHAVRTPAGGWNRVQVSPTDGRTSVYPAVAADSQGGVVVVWEDYRYSPGGFVARPEIFVAVWDGSTWSAPRLISTTAPGTASSWVPAVAVGDDGRAVILWQDRRLGALHAVYRGDENGEVGLVAADGTNPSVGAGGGRVLAAWQTSADAIVGQELGAGSPQTLTTAGRYASVHVNAAGTGYAVWNTPTWGLGHAGFENGAWGNSGQASFPNAYYPSVAVDARGNPHVAFGYGTVRYASASGGGWSDPVTVQASAAYLPILTASPGALHLAYVDTSGGNSEVYYRMRALATRNPVLFIPGFMASKLYEGNELVWVDPPRFISIGDAFLDPLEMDVERVDRLGRIGTWAGLPGADIPPTPANWDAPLFASDYYAGFFHAMVAAGYTPSAGNRLGDFTYFAYDWRRAPNEEVFPGQEALQDALGARIQAFLAANPGATQVDVVTHSTGGLVLKPYLAANPAQIGRVIQVATPHLGVARGFRALQFGQIEFGWLADLVINENQIMQISQNWLGPYALSPSQDFFARAGYGPIFAEINVDLDENGAFESWGWGRVNHWYHHGFYDRNWYATPTRATDNPHNGARATTALEFHNAFDTLAGWLEPNRHVSFFVGQNRATLQRLELSLWDPLDPTWPEAWYLDRRWMGGDGTVPTRSASVDFDGSRSDVTRYYVWNGEHSGLLDDPDVAAAVVALLRDQPPPLPTGKIQRDVPFRDTLTLWEIIFHCPLEVHVFDPSGNHTGPLGDRALETGVPEVHYERTRAPDGTVTTILLPQGKPYELILVSQGAGQFRLTARKIDDDVVTRTVLYDRVPLQPLTTGAFALTEGGELGVLRIDVNGDGGDVRTVPPTATLTGDERADREPPVTSLALSGTVGLGGYYVSDVSLALTADDGPQGSGVRLTQYRLGDVSSWSLYEGALVLTEGCAMPLRYRSQDLNYTVETPREAAIQIDQVPPMIRSFTVAPAQLWPPNHRLVEVVPAAVVSDNCTPSVPWAIESIRMNEGDRENTYDPVHDQWHEQGFTSDDIQVIGGRIYLRAERTGKSGGRAYTLTLKAVDDAGHASRAEARVLVPHDQR